MQTKIIYIKGMHCVSCEKLLDDELKNIPGVTRVHADRKRGVVELGYDKVEPDFQKVKAVVEKFGYTASQKKSEPTALVSKNSWQSWLWAVAFVILIILGFQLFQSSSLGQKIGVAGSGADFGTAFLIGLVASVSSCLVVVGSVVIAFSEKYKGEKSGFLSGAVKPNLFFHFGRLGGFFVLGGLLGAIGGGINISGNFIAIYTIIIAIVLAILGLNILGLFPDIASLGLSMPRLFSAPWGKLKQSENPAAPFLLGVMTFFLPCGFTQSMQILAIASGSFMRGGLGMFFFALGTVPSLLTLGVTTAWSKGKNAAIFQKVAGILIVLFAFYTFNSGLALVGASGDVFGNQNGQKEEVKNTKTDVAEQIVEMHVTNAGFSPSVLHLKKGVPVRWVIKGDSITGCTSKIIIPSLGISQALSSGDNVVTFTPDKIGEIPFSCWMGMVRGKFIVE
ncbi:MAG: sulfite exporter TauE/SafE family protein [Candidatus Moranbacteria bacterium]|nr:sulfite exporter TauE/SafE family protein [Candidatus Moranbacteria bacterium]